MSKSGSSGTALGPPTPVRLFFLAINNSNARQQHILRIFVLVTHMSTWLFQVKVVLDGSGNILMDINNVQPSGEAASVGTQHAGQDIIDHSVNAISRSLVTTHDDLTRKRGGGVTRHESEEPDPEPSNTSRAAGVAEVCELIGHQWLVVGLPEEVEGGSSGCRVQVHCSPGPAGAAPLSHAHCGPLPGRLLFVKRQPTSPLTAAAASRGAPAATYAVT
ncbi:hypothetical protein HaLaN_14661, partial [Haematococcus lacustris]